jgi:ubiquinone/menaquinone biosynthesis C-methylase UbiE
MTQNHKKADQYNDPKHNYLKYWDGRKYEHLAEELALKKLLKNKHFDCIVDVGGGYGRLSILLENYADRVVLAEPSQQQLDIAKTFLKGHPKIERQLLQADDLKFKSGSVDLVTMIRVMHHLPDPKAEFKEIARVLKPNAYAVIEVANYAHFLHRLKAASRLQKLPTTPVDIRSSANKTDNEIAFVNHNPKTVIKQLSQAGLAVEQVLSVSNLRNPKLKQLMPQPVMLSLENVMQKPLSKLYFGPSIFFLVRKVDTSAKRPE